MSSISRQSRCQPLASQGKRKTPMPHAVHRGHRSPLPVFAASLLFPPPEIARQTSLRVDLGMVPTASRSMLLLAFVTTAFESCLISVEYFVNPLRFTHHVSRFTLFCQFPQSHDDISMDMKSIDSRRPTNSESACAQVCHPKVCHRQEKCSELTRTAYPISSVSSPKKRGNCLIGAPTSCNAIPYTTCALT
jgi:hypothetical protein